MDYDKATKLATGTFADILICEDGVTLLKIVRDPSNGDLLLQEAEIVTKLRETDLKDLFPELLDTTTDLHVCDHCPDRFKCFTSAKDFKKDCNMQNKALVYRYDKDMPSLSDVLVKYPNGVDERDMVWMFKRLLAAIHTAHSIGWVHCAVLPEHVLLNLETHGIWLIDWMHVHERGTKPDDLDLKPTHPDYYPDYEIGPDNSTALDIHMAAMCMIKIMGGDISKVSKELRLILRACILGATDAKQVHERFDSEVKKLFGPSVFRPFKV